MHVADAEGLKSVAQRSQISLYPLVSDDADESSSETEYEAEEPEDVDGGGDLEGRAGFGHCDLRHLAS